MSAFVTLCSQAQVHHASDILCQEAFLVMQVFATAGVSKRISLYEYSAIMAHPRAETHRPSQELVTRSKLSCLSWNKYLKTYLASSDYEGVVHVWDIATAQNVAEYEAHEKRIWSVDFCHTDPMLLMSGSDDGMVKVCCSPCCFWPEGHVTRLQARLCQQQLGHSAMGDLHSCDRSTLVLQ